MFVYNFVFPNVNLLSLQASSQTIGGAVQLRAFQVTENNHSKDLRDDGKLKLSSQASSIMKWKCIITNDMENIG